MTPWRRERLGWMVAVVLTAVVSFGFAMYELDQVEHRLTRLKLRFEQFSQDAFLESAEIRRILSGIHRRTQSLDHLMREHCNNVHEADLPPCQPCEAVSCP